MRVAFAPNDERTARRLSEALVVFLAGRGPGRRVETLLKVMSLDVEGEYVLRPVGRPVLHTV